MQPAVQRRQEMRRPMAAGRRKRGSFMREEQKKREQGLTANQESRSALRQQDYILFGEAQKEDDIVNGGAESIERLKKYAYFDINEIQKSVEISRNIWKKGTELLAKGDVSVESIHTGYEKGKKEILAVAEGYGRFNRDEFPIRIVFTRGRVRDWRCECPNCRKTPQYWFTPKTTCACKAAFLLAIEKVLSKENIADATDYGAYEFLQYYQLKSAVNTVSKNTGNEKPLILQPRLLKKDGELSVSFRIGETKLFVVKKLDEFIKQVHESAIGEYGTKTSIHHDMNRFSEMGKKWIQYINRIVQEEERFRERMMESRYFYGSHVAVVGSSLKLFGWRLDEFYHLLEKEPVEFEDRDSAEKKKGMIEIGRAHV